MQKNSVDSSPLLASRLSVKRQACSWNGGPYSKTDGLSWSWRAIWRLGEHVEGHSVQGLATAVPCISGHGPAVPAESSLSCASNALQQCDMRVYLKVFIGRGHHSLIGRRQHHHRLRRRRRLSRDILVLDLGIDSLLVARALLYEPAPLEPGRAPD